MCHHAALSMTEQLSGPHHGYAGAEEVRCWDLTFRTGKRRYIKQTELLLMHRKRTKCWNKKGQKQAEQQQEGGWSFWNKKPNINGLQALNSRSKPPLYITIKKVILETFTLLINEKRIPLLSLNLFNDLKGFKSLKCDRQMSKLTSGSKEQYNIKLKALNLFISWTKGFVGWYFFFSLAFLCWPLGCGVKKLQLSYSRS